MTTGFLMMAVAGPANADKGGEPNENSNGNGSQSSQSDDGPGKSEDSNGKGNNGNGNNGNGNGNGNANSNGNNGNGKDNDKKVDVCHATSSMTNPYVFINVSENAVKKNGHRMHRDAPNKSWNEAAVWNGTLYAAGAARPDYISSLDGPFTEAWCEAAPTAPQPPAGPGPAVVPPAVVPPAVVPPDIAGTDEVAPKPDKKPTVKGTEAVPTAVDAGIGGPTITGSSPIDLMAQMLVGGGLALLMAAGWLQIGRQTNGVHLN